MIEHITIRNFKSIREVSVDLSPVTVLIGRSGVGKSNFLRAIRFLRNFLLLGDPAVVHEGGWQRIWPFGDPVPLSFSVRFSIPGYSESFTYELSWTAHSKSRPDPTVAAEHLSIGGSIIFAHAGKDWSKWPGDDAALSPTGSSTFLNAFPTLSETVLAYTAWTSGVGWHDFPATVFSKGLKDEGLVRRDGRQVRSSGLTDAAGNYLDVIRDITQDLRNQTSRRQILARIKQINPTVGSLELDSITDPTRVVVAHVVGDRRIGLDLSQESDGFRRYYAHLLALYQTPPKQVLMFEEPENGIYPGALRNLAEEFNAAAGGGRGQVLLSTQSPDLLDGFTAESLRVVELDDKQSTKIGPLDSDQVQAVKDRLLEPGELLTVDRGARGGSAGIGGEAPLPKRLVIFVEGKGDLKAVPTLAQRVVERIAAYDALFVDHEPFRVRSVGTLVKNDCFDWHRWLSAAGNTRKPLGAVLLVLDGDLKQVPRDWKSYSDRYGSNEFCACRVAAMLGREARSSRAGDAFSLATVFVMKEFEAWLIAGVEGLRGLSLPEERGAVPDTAAFPDIDIESRRNAKGELRTIIPAYSATLDQGVLAANVDLDRVLERCRSFRRFENAIRQLADSVRKGAAMVSPAVQAAG